MNLKNILGILLLTVFFSCEQNEDILDTNNLLLGSWIEPSYNSEATIYTRGSSLPTENHGISFSENGEFIECSSGWCATPPLSYTDYIGSFEIDDTLITITTASFPNRYQWRIISLTEEKLVIKRELSTQEKEHNDLMVMFDTIQSLVRAIACNDASNLTFTAYGTKACGGPQGYIAYASHMDTADFLNKIELYTEAEKEFNITWGIISDCSISPQPIAVECNNGYPTLIY